MSLAVDTCTANLERGSNVAGLLSRVGYSGLGFLYSVYNALNTIVYIAGILLDDNYLPGEFGFACRIHTSYYRIPVPLNKNKLTARNDIPGVLLWRVMRRPKSCTEFSGLLMPSAAPPAVAPRSCRSGHLGWRN